MYKISLFLLLAHCMPLAAGCGQSSMRQVAPQPEIYLDEEEWKQAMALRAEMERVAQGVSLLEHLKRRGRVCWSKQEHEQYLRTIRGCLKKGGRVDEKQIQHLIDANKITDEALALIRAANAKKGHRSARKS